MRKLAEVCIQRPIFAAMLILSMCVVGAAAYMKLGVDRLPSVDLPTVSIRTSLPGASRFTAGSTRWTSSVAAKTRGNKTAR